MNPADTVITHLSGFDDKIVVSTGGKIFLSGDSGSTWSQSQALHSAGDFTFARNGSTLFAADSWQGLGCYRSTDSGRTWTRPGSYLPNFRILSLAAMDGYVFATTNTGEVYVSGDNGDSWVPPAKGSPNHGFTGTFAAGGKLFGYGSTDSSRIYVSSDHAATWEGIGEGLGNVLAVTIALSGDNLFLGTAGNGVWRRPLSEMGASGIQGSGRGTRPSSEYGFTVSRQGRSGFSISFELPRSEIVVLAVKDVNQKTVSFISNRRFSSGRQTLNWNPADLTAGSYLVQIRIGKSALYRSITVLR